MKLYDILYTAQYYQNFTVYITNAYDQNLCIGRGMRSELLNEDKNGSCIFDHLFDEVEYWLISRCTQNQLVIFIKDDGYNKRAEERFSTSSDSWGETVSERPWRYAIETEIYTDEYLNKVYA